MASLEAEKFSELPTLGQADDYKLDSKSDIAVKEEASSDYLDSEDVVLLKGEPVVTTGSDVSRFVVDLRDDGETALTFRSFVLGTVMAGLGAALCQVRHVVCGIIFLTNAVPQIYLFKPVQMSVSTVFLLLIIYTIGNAWARFLPRASLVEGTRFESLAPIISFINPGEFMLKEVSVDCLSRLDRELNFCYVACCRFSGGLHRSWR